MESFNLLIMDHGEGNKTSIIDIFNSMEFEGKMMENNTENFMDYLNNGDEVSHKLSQMLKATTLKPKSLESSVDSAVKAHTKWKKTPCQSRADLLHKIWESLTKKSQTFSKLGSSIQNEFSILIDYFDYYSDLAVQANCYNGDGHPVGVVLVVLSNHSPFIVLGATVSAALAAGCSVIVLAQDKTELFAFFLEELMSEAGLPDGVFNVVKESAENDKPLPNKIHKVIYSGNYSGAQQFYKRSLSKSFNFFCPNNTTAFVLESCDLSAAADKIFSETWGINSSNMWAVSTVVVQEAVYKQFLDKLKFRMDQFRMENKNCLKFKSKIILEKMNKVIYNASKVGATVEMCWNSENEWGPTVILNYQDQEDDADVPILKVLTCRTAKEGVSLLNNCRFSLGTSIWTEISSEALEVASKLICPNKWINCHGILKANIPLQTLGNSGNCVFGGIDGLYEFISSSNTDLVEGNKNEEDKSLQPDKLNVLQIIAAAKSAFSKWCSVKNKRKYLKDIANMFEGDKELSKLSALINDCSHQGNRNLSESDSDEFFVVHKKVPVGVITLFVNTSNVDITSIVFLITSAIAFGNTIIVVLKEENSVKEFQSIEKYFNKYLPKNVLSVIIGGRAANILASDPSVQALWLYDETSISLEFLQVMRNYSAKSLKDIWIVPKIVPTTPELPQKKCLRNTFVCLTKIDQFP